MSATNEPRIVYWHRELPPSDAELMGEHTLEASSSHVPATIAHRDELWHECYRGFGYMLYRRAAQP
jgi:hypothetical protein